MAFAECLATIPGLDLLAWWIYGIGALSAAIGAYAAILLIVRHEIRCQMRGYLIAGTILPRNKLGQFVSRK